MRQHQETRPEENEPAAMTATPRSANAEPLAAEAGVRAPNRGRS